MRLSLDDAIRVWSKAAGVFPADLGRALCSATSSDWELIRWIEAPGRRTIQGGTGPPRGVPSPWEAGIL